jgi:hypothetical protein
MMNAQHGTIDEGADNYPPKDTIQEDDLVQFPMACCNRRFCRKTNDATAFGMVS